MLGEDSGPLPVGGVGHESPVLGYARLASVAQKASAVRDKIAAALLAADGRRFADAEAARAFAESELDFATSSTYGGATSCVEIEAGGTDDAFIICDLGSGVREFGIDAMGRCAAGHARTITSSCRTCTGTTSWVSRSSCRCSTRRRRS
jgi:hypothetical protein